MSSSKNDSEWNNNCDRVKAEFIPYQESLELKELGFDEPCVYYVDKDNNSYIYNFETNPDEFIEWCGVNVIPAPTFSQAFSWFREKYKLHGGIHQSGDMDDRYTFRINFTCYPHNSVGRGNEYSYPEAELECLKKLLEIVKNKVI